MIGDAGKVKNSRGEEGKPQLVCILKKSLTVLNFVLSIFIWK
jgi:hypothetical protein